MRWSQAAHTQRYLALNHLVSKLCPLQLPLKQYQGESLGLVPVYPEHLSSRLIFLFSAQRVLAPSSEASENINTSLIFPTLIFIVPNIYSSALGSTCKVMI